MREPFLWSSIVMAAAVLCGGCGNGRLALSGAENIPAPAEDGGVEPPPIEVDTDAGIGSDSGPIIGREFVSCDAVPTGDEVLEVGAGRAYATISAAVAAANAGAVVLVHAGTYAEQVQVDKAVTIALFGDGDVWIDGGCATERPNGIAIRSANVVVRCMGIRNTTNASVFIRGTEAHDITVEGMVLEDYQCADNGDAGAAHHGGVAAQYTGARIRVVGNELRRRAHLPGEQRGMAYGIAFISSSTMPSGGGHYIAYNTIEGGRDGIGGGPEDDDHGSFDRDTIIEHNDIRGCDDDGIQVEGGNMNVVVRNNHIDGCAVGIALAPNRVGPLRIENNFIENLVPGYYGAADCFKVGDNGGGTAFLTHNVCRTAVGKGITQTNPGNNPFVVEENVFQVAGYVYEFSDPLPSTTRFDRNCLFTSDEGRFAKWGAVRYYSLLSFQEATGQEAGGQQTTDCSWLQE